MQFALFHSPVVGPSTWRWVAEALGQAGHDVVLPDLRPAARTGSPAAVIASAVAAVPAEWSSAVLVGHSGFGSMLPSVAAPLRERSRRMVFVDAGLPPCDGRTTASADFLKQLRRLAVDGVLPKWSTWWGEDVMEGLVPTAQRRHQVEADLPEIPLAFYESPIGVPDGWCQREGAYLLLSEAYRADATRAHALRWPVVERLRGHLDLVNDPDGTARIVVDLAS